MGRRGSLRNQQKKDPGQKAKLVAELSQLREDRQKLLSRPYWLRKPEDVAELRRIEGKIKKIVGKIRKSDQHSQKGKGAKA